MLRLLIVALLIGSAFGQSGGNTPGGIAPVTVAPSGSCSQNQVWLLVPSGVIYTCQNGTPGPVSGAAGSAAWGTVTSGTNGATLVEGTGGSLTPSGTGVISANQVNGAVVPASAQFVGTNSNRQIVSVTGGIGNVLGSVLTGVSVTANVPCMLTHGLLLTSPYAVDVTAFNSTGPVTLTIPTTSLSANTITITDSSTETLSFVQILGVGTGTPVQGAASCGSGGTISPTSAGPYTATQTISSPTFSCSGTCT
jgi:hypothetical protein